MIAAAPDMARNDGIGVSGRNRCGRDSYEFRAHAGMMAAVPD